MNSKNINMYNPNGTKEDFLSYLAKNTIENKLGKYLFSYYNNGEYFTIFVYNIRKKDEIGCMFVEALYDPKVCIFVSNDKSWLGIDEYDNIIDWQKAVEENIKKHIDWDVITGKKIA